MPPEAREEAQRTLAAIRERRMTALRPQSDRTIRELLDRMRHNGCGGDRAGVVLQPGGDYPGTSPLGVAPCLKRQLPAREMGP